MSKINFTIETLIKVAQQSDISYKHSAGLIYDDKIHSISVNKFVPFKKYKGIQLYRTIHAELSIFEKIPKRVVKGMDIIVIRINKKLQLRNSRPCKDCIDELKQIGIRKVYYSNDNGDIVYEFVENMIKTHTSAGMKFCKELIR
jgi:deoxycytidylate deaminase